MKIKSFIEDVCETLGIDVFKKSTKKKSIKNLIKKLENKKNELIESHKKKSDKKKRKEINQEIDIIEIQIKKAQKVLDKLNKE